MAWSGATVRGRRAWARAGRRLAALGALVALAACVPAPAPAPELRAHSAAFPRVHPAELAHLLADFSTHPHAAQPWHVEEERGNYSAWSYRVSFECGARCAGAAAVSAHAGGAPRHGRAPHHAVRLELRACERWPLLPWPRVCDEMEVEWRVYGDATSAGGSVLEENTRAWCGALRVLSGACARDLRALRHAHRERLRAALDARPYS